MLTRWLLAAGHLLGLGIGLGAVWARARGLRGPLDGPGLRRVFAADTWWGIAALVWIATGLWRLLAGTEKSTGYYIANHVFWLKMAAFVLILLLEARPMLTLVRWRRQVAQGESPDTRIAARLTRTSYLQAGLLIVMLLAATAMARGLGARPQ